MANYQFLVKFNDGDSPEARCVQTLDRFFCYRKERDPSGEGVRCVFRDVFRDRVTEPIWNCLNQEERHGFATIGDLFDAIEKHGKRIDDEETL